MNENLKKFLEEASKNEELKAKLTALTDKETAVAKAVELAKEYGFALTAEDFQPADGAELSLDELDSVAGGWCLFQAAEAVVQRKYHIVKSARSAKWMKR